MDTVIGLVIFLVVLALGVFVIWMFVDMLRDKIITPGLKIVWVLGFVFLTVIATAVYYFDQYRHKATYKAHEE